MTHWWLRLAVAMLPMLLLVVRLMTVRGRLG